MPLVELRERRERRCLGDFDAAQARHAETLCRELRNDGLCVLFQALSRRKSCCQGRAECVFFQRSGMDDADARFCDELISNNESVVLSNGAPGQSAALRSFFDADSARPRPLIAATAGQPRSGLAMNRATRHGSIAALHQ